MSDLYILYRGPLGSCNYDCRYCPFAKHRSDPAELDADRRGLKNFTAWVTNETQHRHSLLFTPWGEALVRRWYPEALISLSHLPHVRRVAIQTNLSASIDWIADAQLDTLALWTTFHPSQVSLDRYLGRCQTLLDRGVRFSVGIVGTRENAPFARQLRDALPQHVYVWVNAYKSEGPNYYAHDVRAHFEAIDPLFAINAVRHPSQGYACQAGESSFTVDGEGDVRRCHFIAEPLGNLYTDRLESMLAPRPCTNDTCGCHIGYVHLERLGLRARFGNGLMERIPTEVAP